MANFNLTVISPDGFHHWRAFSDIIDSLAWSLSALGHNVSLTSNWFSESAETNVILGAELMADFQRVPRNSIIYNLEQPSHPRLDVVRRIVKESGCAVWDYSLRSVADWRERRISAVAHLPLGFTPNLGRLSPGPDDYDVCFLGWMTERRTAMIQSLRAAGLRVYSSAQCYGGARDSVLSRSRIALNIHHDGRDRFEIARCGYYLANSLCVVTEPSADDDEYADLRSGMSISPYRALVDTCAALAQAPSERARIAGAGHSAFIRRDFTSAVAAALEATPPSAAATPSRPLTHAVQRDATRKSYLAGARALANKSEWNLAVDYNGNAQLIARYAQARQFGDMKDFVEWIHDHARGIIVEIGVRDGASTSAFLMGLGEQRGEGHLYSIDINDCSNLFGIQPQWTFIKADSGAEHQRVLSLLPPEIDILLIDGDHSRAGVLADCAYIGLVRPGGMVLFHDIAPEPRPANAPADWPDDSVKQTYESLCRGMAAEGWTHEELPGRYGLGVLRRPLPKPQTSLAPSSEVTA